MAETHFSHETLEAGTMQRRRRRSAKVIIDDHHLVLASAELAGTVRQRVLQTCRLLVLQHLAHCRLPDIDNRLSLTVPSLDLVRGQQGSARHRCAHGRSPDRSPPRGADGPACRPARSGAAAARAAGPATGSASVSDGPWRLAIHLASSRRASWPSRGAIGTSYSAVPLPCDVGRVQL